MAAGIDALPRNLAMRRAMRPTIVHAAARVALALMAFAAGAVAAQPAASGAAETAAGLSAEPASQSPLTARILARRETIAADLTIPSDQRRAFDTALAQLLATARPVDEAAVRLDTANAARARSGSGVEVVDPVAAFAQWRAHLSPSVSAVDLWPQIARVVDELHMLRRAEQDLMSVTLAGGAERVEAEPDLAAPVQVDTLVAALPDHPVHTRAIADLARELEQRRLDVAAATSVARRRSLVDRVEGLGAERAAIAGRVDVANRKIEFLDAELSRIVGGYLEIVRGAAQRTLDQSARGDPRRAIARDVAALADECGTLVRRTAAAQQSAIAHEATLSDIARVWARTRDRLAVQGASEALGLVLVSDMARTLPPREVAGDLSALRRDIADIRLRLVDLRTRLLDARVAKSDLSQVELLKRLRNDGSPDESLLETTRFRLLLIAEAANFAFSEALAGDEATLAELDRRNRELRALIGSRLLWTPSHGPINSAWFAGLTRRLVEGRIGRGMRRELSTSGSRVPDWLPGPAWGFGIAVALVIGWRWLWARRKRLMAGIATEGVTGLRQAIEAVVITAVLAAPWALIAGLLFALLRGTDAPSGFYGSVVRDAIPGFWTILVLVGLILMAAPNGVGRVVLGWAEDSRRGIRRAAIALLVLIAPSHVGVSAAWYRGDLAALEYESRAVFIIAWLGVAIVFWRALRPGGVWFGIDAGRRSLARRLLRFGLVGAALGAAIAAAMGYQITAAAITGELEGTIGVLATLLILHGLALQGIALGERRAVQWQAVADDLARKEGQAVESPRADAAGNTDVGTVGAHSRSLVGFLIAVGGAIWLLAQWSDLIPALWRLDDIALWHVTVKGDGGDELEAVSALDLVLAVAAAALIVVGLRRLPGMLDLLLRQRSTVDAGTRFAISAMTRYTLALIGVMVTLGLVGVRWSHLQWMAAALTVGLGFGLQEIFANFVSGLILLFERPVRVGDVVTVGDVTGTVANISTRATTVVDFDRREVLIPNKTLITDRLINWTLSNETTRITVKVGVGYDTQPDLAHRLLRQAAIDVPAVLDHPAPVTVFTGFGASNLEFELRAFVGKFDDRLPASNALHQRILAVFREAGVAIDYDQLDVRLVQPGPGSPAPEPGVPAPGSSGSA